MRGISMWRLAWGVHSNNAYGEDVGAMVQGQTVGTEGTVEFVP